MWSKQSIDGLFGHSGTSNDWRCFIPLITCSEYRRKWRQNGCVKYDRHLTFSLIASYLFDCLEIVINNHIAWFNTIWTQMLIYMNFHFRQKYLSWCLFLSSVLNLLEVILSISWKGFKLLSRYCFSKWDMDLEECFDDFFVQQPPYTNRGRKPLINNFFILV